MSIFSLLKPTHFHKAQVAPIYNHSTPMRLHQKCFMLEVLYNITSNIVQYHAIFEVSLAVIHLHLITVSHKLVFIENHDFHTALV